MKLVCRGLLHDRHDLNALFSECIKRVSEDVGRDVSRWRGALYLMGFEQKGMPASYIGRHHAAVRHAFFNAAYHPLMWSPSSNAPLVQAGAIAVANGEWLAEFPNAGAITEKAGALLAKWHEDRVWSVPSTNPFSADRVKGWVRLDVWQMPLDTVRLAWGMYRAIMRMASWYDASLRDKDDGIKAASFAWARGMRIGHQYWCDRPQPVAKGRKRVDYAKRIATIEKRITKAQHAARLASARVKKWEDKLKAAKRAQANQK